jgi:HD-GYP domain-containing protein (c-di-GMP phosphodiesterase class II)
MDEPRTRMITAPPPVRPCAHDWSGGYFSTTGCQIPQTCLDRCLSGDPGRAGTDGCAFLRRLALRFSDGYGPESRESLDLPPTGVCSEGCQVSMRADSAESRPITLVLHSPFACEREESFARPAIEALHGAAWEHWRLNQENEGLANEVLQCYEQVNLIFDISGQVADLAEDSDVRRVLLEKLQVIYDADQVLCIDPDAEMVFQVAQDGRFSSVQADALLPYLQEVGGACGSSEPWPRRIEDVPLPSETVHALRQLRVCGRSVVTCVDGDAFRKRGYGTSLWGPLRHEKNRLAAVGVIRRGRCFEAGDMLLLDSALTFGSHILGNLRLIEQLKRTSFESVHALANAIDQKDPYTSGHSERVGFLAWAIGKRMNLSSTQLRELEWGGLLHDIGKIGTPEHVLNKPGALTDEEYAIIKDHPARGHAILAPVASLTGVLDVVLYHHERPDGKGYPEGLAGDSIPLLARIVHVADTFDALTSTRSYRRAYGHARALEIMLEDTGSMLDVEVMDAFLETLERLPQDHPEEYLRWFASCV